jgi:hypothetical protein
LRRACLPNFYYSSCWIQTIVTNLGVTSTVTMESALEQGRCEKCRANTSAVVNLQNLRGLQTVIMQATFAALESSARDGCDLCRLLRQGLIFSTASQAEYEALIASKQSVVLWYSPANRFQKGMFPPSTRDNFVVSCSVYPKWHKALIPFHHRSGRRGKELANSSEGRQKPSKRRIPANIFS